MKRVDYNDISFNTLYHKTMNYPSNSPEAKKMRAKKDYYNKKLKEFREIVRMPVTKKVAEL